ncbi:N-acetylglucosamine kinase [Lacticaseibacillus kribbianus]|uniref:N-acetylglucosamine kinase n=1 Tax=Lacticaseibacillus kribbianus TaxID=2926292 RepID=UPI001CD643A9|nr:BadF/BadG/BcrA/BcrD ATPase family protein [Lacticaseibacillus kribbianus]
MTYLIGIDSGGTHIVATAWAPDGRQLAQVTAGPGNVFLDAAGTRANLTAAVTALTAQLKGETCSQVLIGIAGVETTGDAPALAAEFTAAFGIPTAVISDAQLALLNGLEGADGTLVIAGTGSIVYGRQAGRFTRYGGWGQLLGDTGSAYKLVQAAMVQALADHDQGRPTKLAATLPKLLEASDMSGAVRRFYAGTRQDLASLAAKLAPLAETDAETGAVFTAQARALAAEICGLMARYAAPRPTKLALSGSVLTHNAAFRKQVIAAVRLSYPDVEAAVVTTNNSRGVLFWARWAE